MTGWVTWGTVVWALFQTALGAIIALVIAAIFDVLRRPALRISLAKSNDVEYLPVTNKPARHARYLGLDLINERPPRWAFWVSRLTAVECRGTITFHHLQDGQPVFERAMPIKWSGRGGAVRPIIIRGKEPWGWILTPGSYDPGAVTDINADGNARLDVAAKFDDDDECYGWTAENELSNPLWRNPSWRLREGRYLVRVQIRAANAVGDGVFRLVNDVPRNNFRLMETLPADKDVVAQLIQ
jgi:hypothetical protein